MFTSVVGVGVGVAGQKWAGWWRMGRFYPVEIVWIEDRARVPFEERSRY